MILTFSAFKCNTVYKYFEIDYCCIAVLDCTILNVDDSCIFLKLFVDFCCYIFICYCSVYFSNCYTNIFSKCYFRFCSNFCCEDKRFAFLDLSNINNRSGYDILSTLFCCISICLRDQCVCCVFVEYACTVHFLNHSSRNFSFTESRHADIFFLSVICFLKCFLQLFSRNFNGKLYCIFF